MTYPPSDPNPTPSFGGSPITGTDWNQLLNLVTGSYTKSGSLTLSPGSNLIIQNGSFVLTNGTIGAIAHYVIISGSAYNTATNNIDFTNNDVGALLNTLEANVP
jgi:hypothetical protein